MKPATIYDVARLAGVSHQTVSRFLSGFEGIRPETRSRVESALAELDYRPNAAARQLRTRRVNRIAAITERVDQIGPARLLAGATEAARERGYLLDVILTRGLDADSDGAASALALVNEQPAAGVVAIAGADALVAYFREHAPALPIARDSQLVMQQDGMTMNEYAGAIAADHLLDLGHRRIGYLSGPTVWLAGSGRRAGFEQRVADRGGELVWSAEGDWTAGSGARAWHDLRASERAVTAVAAGNDSMAIGLISAAAADGVAVPGDLSVIGNDDIHESQYLLPPLTTVSVDFEGEGRALVEELLAQVGGASVDRSRIRTPRVVARGSTRPL